MSFSRLSSLSNTTLSKKNTFPTPIIQYIFNSAYTTTVSSNTYLQNRASSIYDLNLQTATLTTKNTFKCVDVTSNYAMVDSAVTGNATSIVGSSSTYPAVTITMWIYETSTQAQAGIFNWNLTSDNTKCIEFQVSAGNIYCWFNTGGLWKKFGAVTLNTWTFIAMTFDGANAALYMNNTTGESGTTGVTNANFLNINRNCIWLGREIYYPGDAEFAGCMADFRMYGSALSATQISAIYSSGISNS